jgi:hypothetical protein
MSRKLIISIVVLSFALLELLATRQAQLNTVNQMSNLHRAIDETNETIASLSIDIETACSPSSIQNTLATAPEVHANN